ncbi:DNA-binding HxlR family transcriptional regulator [Nocardioides thalensis]|uniref:DNA-binding HxlR family transcriptional regulator n=1 Tax=Nocardioides thalensis TaxID=1914755 RepID=A0A853BX03_9ACTN|nr:DNA-binding HxlR family transcriptional regulator [Nocardioides thalensis]
MEHDVFLADCPARTTLGVIGNTWTVVVVAALGESDMRYGELQTRIGGISKKMLTQTLRHLVDSGLVARSAEPPRHYSLTDLGRTLLEPVAALVRWAEENAERLLDPVPD